MLGATLLAAPPASAINVSTHPAITHSTATSSSLSVYWRGPTSGKAVSAYKVVLASDRAMSKNVITRTTGGSARGMTIPLPTTAAGAIGRLYYVRVYAKAGKKWKNDLSVWSNRYSDGLRPTDPPHFEYGAASCTGFTARWSRFGYPANARGLQVEVATNRTFAGSWFYNGYQPTEYVTVSNLTPGQTYYARVRAISGREASNPTGPQTIKIPQCASEPFRVASYNVSKDNLFGKGSRAWQNRRKPVASAIASNADIVGVQEARPVSSYRGRPAQVVDLNGLLGPGYSTVKTWGGVHIIYRNALFEAVGRTEQVTSNGTAAYAVAQMFRQRSTGRTFIFTSLHTNSGSNDVVRSQQAANALELAGRLDPSGRVPRILVGDLSTSTSHDTRLRATISRWLGDTEYFSPFRRLSRLNSNNEWLRKPKTLAGIKVDAIMASGNVSVMSWWMNAKVKGRPLKFMGTMPSDHNLIAARVRLPVG